MAVGLKRVVRAWAHAKKKRYRNMFVAMSEARLWSSLRLEELDFCWLRRFRGSATFGLIWLSAAAALGGPSKCRSKVD